MSKCCNTQTESYTAKEWLFGCVNFSIPEDGAISILGGRGLNGNELFADLSQQQKDLLKADLYVWICMGASKVDSESDADNGWSHKGGGYTLSSEDKERMLDAANALYDKWDEESPVEDNVKVTVESFGIMHCDYGCCGVPLPHVTGKD